VQVVGDAPSRAHVKLEPVSVEWKLKVAVVLAEFAAGAESITVSGGVVSVLIVHVYESGDASVLPARSIARTWNVCEPCASAA
jgi:hypothetical protein